MIYCFMLYRILCAKKSKVYEVILLPKSKCNVCICLHIYHEIPNEIANFISSCFFCRTVIFNGLFYLKESIYQFKSDYNYQMVFFFIKQTVVSAAGSMPRAEPSVAQPLQTRHLADLSHFHGDPRRVHHRDAEMHLLTEEHWSEGEGPRCLLCHEPFSPVIPMAPGLLPLTCMFTEGTGGCCPHRAWPTKTGAKVSHYQGNEGGGAAIGKRK